MRNLLHFVLPLFLSSFPVATNATDVPSGRVTGSEYRGDEYASVVVTSFTFEAECATIGSDWVTEQDASASSNRYVVYRGLKPSSARPSGAPETLLRFELEAAQAGQYNLFARARAEQTDENDMWVRVNDGDWLRWQGFTNTGNFAWNPLSTTPVLLEDGLNTVDIVYKSINIQVDKIHIDVDASLPLGEGEADPDCPDLPGNEPPVAVASADPVSGNAPLSVTFDGSGSSDPDGSIVSYSWNLGSTTLTGNPASTTFTLPGTYVVTLTVTDNDGATATDNVTVNVLQEVVDSDGDGVPDDSDNCPTVANPDQQLITFYADADGDGFGDPAVSVEACEAPEGYVDNADDNCPTVANPDQQLITFYADADGDGFGDPAVSVEACEAPEGYVDNADDNCPTVANPDQQLTTFYADADGDGFGDPAVSVEACEAPEGYVDNADDNCPDFASTDLTDTDGDGIGDVCENDSDNDGVVDAEDCDPLDPEVGGPVTYYADADGDGFGDPAVSVEACEVPEGYVSNADDNCPTVANPDQQLTTFYADADGDGFGDPAVSVEACEAPEGYVDNADDNCPTVANPDQQLTTFYADVDGDGFGDPAVSVEACEAPEGYVDNADDNCPDFASTDLTDTDGDGIGDACDTDSDNDGVVDFLDCDRLDPDVAYRRIFFADTDGDGIGDTRDYIYSCLQPEGYVSRFGDNCPTVYNPSQADTNGDGIGDACQGPVLTDGNYWLEGECMTLSSGWAVVENTLASKNLYVLFRGIGNLSPPTETNEGSQVETTVEVLESDTYHLFFRMNAWRSSSNSFWVQVDDGPWLNFSKFIGGTDIATSGFQWVKVNDEGTDISFSLEPGTHTVRVANRSSYTMLDKILLSTSSATPSGLGGEATNCGQNTVAPEPGLDLGGDPTAPFAGAAAPTAEAVLEVFPNPVRDRFSFRLATSYRGNVTVLIADASGRTIRKSEYLKSDVELQDQIDVSRLPLGTYTVRVIEGDRQQIRKFVKLR